VDDHDVVRAGLRRILERRARWEVVGEAADGGEAVAQASALNPDIVLVDFSLPVINGVEVTRQIRSRLPNVEVLVFTMHDREILMAELLKAGARGYLLKSDAVHLLEAAVESLALHRPFFTDSVSKAMVSSYLKGAGPSSIHPLTQRECGVVKLVAEGHSNKEIAAILSITLKTVETHRASAMRKLNYTSSASLIRYAVRNKLVDP